jgi:glycine dehydrogenase subunit 1
MIAELAGMEVSNASLYDGGTAAVEGVLMAARLQNLKSGVVLVSEGSYARTRKILESYLAPLGFKIEIWRANPKTLTCDESTLPDLKGEPIVALLMQSPNTWGLIENWKTLSNAASRLKTKSVALVAHAHSLAVFSPPGHNGVDIVTGEGQTLGIPVGFGGPYLGLFACRKSDVRQMPGRLVGATTDSRGEAAFCVTLATREQHIRREKATSNICSNQNLMAMRACIYMTLMGPEGMRKVAELSRSKAHYARAKLSEALAKSSLELKVAEGEIFNELAILVPQKKALWIEEALKRAEDAGFLAGVSVPVPGESGYVSALVVAFTENHKAHDIDRLVGVLCQQGESGPKSSRESERESEREKS